jgi:hypothetical protein
MDRKYWCVGIATLFLPFAFIGCGDSTGVAPRSFDATPFASFDARTLLCLDFRDDRGRPAGGLILRLSSADTGGRKGIVLPFTTRFVGTNRSYISSSASYDGYTIVDVSIGSRSVGAGPIPLVPATLELGPETLHERALAPGLYYSENGQERWMILVDSAKPVAAKLASEFRGTHFETPEAIAIALPAKAEGRQVRPGLTVFPAPSVNLANTMLFANRQAGTNDRIELRYVVPPTASQLAVSNSGFKLLLVLILPILSLVLLSPNDIGRPTARRILIGVLVLLQLALATFIVWASFSSGREISATTYLDLTTAAIGVAGEAAVLWVKSRKHPAQITHQSQ